MIYASVYYISYYCYHHDFLFSVEALGGEPERAHTRRRRIREPRSLPAPLSMVEVSVRRLPGQFLDAYRCFIYLYNNYIRADSEQRRRLMGR